MSADIPLGTSEESADIGRRDDDPVQDEIAIEEPGAGTAGVLAERQGTWSCLNCGELFVDSLQGSVSSAIICPKCGGQHVIYAGDIEITHGEGGEA